MATRETWKRRVEAWKTSGLPEEDFAIGRGFGGSALRAAAQRLRAEPEVRLARVDIIAEQIPQEVPVVVRTGGLRIELMRGFSREALESALDVIEGRRR